MPQEGKNIQSRLCAVSASSAPLRWKKRV